MEGRRIHNTKVKPWKPRERILKSHHSKHKTRNTLLIVRFFLLLMHAILILLLWDSEMSLWCKKMNVSFAPDLVQRANKKVDQKKPMPPFNVNKGLYFTLGPALPMIWQSTGLYGQIINIQNFP